MNKLKNIDFLKIESAVWVANKRINVPAYDFEFEPLFQVGRSRIEDNVTVVGRIGALMNYSKMYEVFSKHGFDLINTPEQHLLASELEQWYPIIKELTPKSMVYESFPTLKKLYQEFDFPVFIKGNRQTSKHSSNLSIAKTESEFQKIKEGYRNDPILHWQKVVLREFIDLKPLEYKANDKVQISHEFRTFWWKNELVGTGHYWSQYLDYDWTENEEKRAIEVASSAVQLLNVPFIAIDLALTKDDSWIIIECNDAQESGYCGVRPLVLWKNIVDIEKRNAAKNKQHKNVS